MPDRSGTWDVGFPALLPEHPATNPSIPNSDIPISDKNDQHNRFVMYKRPPQRSAPKHFFAVGLDQLDEAPHAPASLRGIEGNLDDLSRLQALSIPAAIRH